MFRNTPNEKQFLLATLKNECRINIFSFLRVRKNLINFVYK